MADLTWTKRCDRCGQKVERWRNQGAVQCIDCHAWYNAYGFRLRDDWPGNPTPWDDETSDLTYYHTTVICPPEAE